MSARVQVPMKLAPPRVHAIATELVRSLKPAPSGLLQRKCACGGTASSGDGCEDCKKKTSTLQRSSTGRGSPAIAPPIVHEVLRSPGQPLDRRTRSFFEPRFGHDFSKVRVHTDERAQESAQAVNALAYTVGRNVVFGTGQFAPNMSSGQRLLAHELMHVIQQGGQNPPGHPLRVGPSGDSYEREAEAASTGVGSKEYQQPRHIAFPSVQRACGPAAIGAPSGCIPLSGDASGELIRFNVNCTEFKPGEEGHLRGFAGTLASGASVRIHGFASQEGDRTFNENLACARAIKGQEVIADVLRPKAINVSFSLFKHGATPGNPEDRRSIVIDLLPAAPEPKPKPEPSPTPEPGPKPPTPAPAPGVTPPSPPPPRSGGTACFDGKTVVVTKNGTSISCPAFTYSDAPTPSGQFCIRKQGEAQRGWSPFRTDRSGWYLLEPQFTTTRSRMDLHPGSISKGCVTVTDSDCFKKIAGVLNSPGTTVGDGYDGYPPGNSEKVDNPKKSVDCVAMLQVNYAEGACGPTPPTPAPAPGVTPPSPPPPRSGG